MKTLKINRTIRSAHLRIDELNDWLGKEVDIIIKEKESASSPSDSYAAAGILSDYQSKDRIKKEKYGWIKAVKEKLRISNRLFS